MAGPVLFSNGNLRVKSCRHGVFAYFINDFYIGRSLDLYGEYSEGEAHLFGQIIKPGMVVVEIGANIGTHTVFLAHVVGPKGLIIAFEPQRPIYHLLCANIALNNLLNVVTHEAAVGSAAGSITMPALDYRKIDNFGGVELGQMSGGARVPVVTIDSMNFQQCHFLKIDVEGMELSVLQGAIVTIGNFRPGLYLENDREEKSRDLVAFILSQKYRIYWHTPNLYNKNNYLSNKEDVFGGIISRNIVCIPEEMTLTMENFVEIVSPEKATWPP